MSPSIRIDLESNRRPGERSWNLPSWGHPLAMGVFPLFISHERKLTPMGTAFCISRIGTLATALHNVLESLSVEGIPVPPVHGPFAQPDLSIALQRAGFAVFHQRQPAAGSITGTVWPLETIDALPPSDLAFGFPRFQTHFPYLHFPVTFELPRIGSSVTCVGYGSCEGTGVLDFDVLEAGELDVGSAYSHSFQAVEGTVSEIFVKQFAAGYLAGPCFSIDADVPHGLSGGPALTPTGSVCGVVSAGASGFFGRPTTLISPFYPALLSSVRFGASFDSVRIASTQRLIDLIESDTVKTDGSEEHLNIVQEDGHYIVGPRIHRDDHAHVHDDFEAYQTGAGATRVTTRSFRFRRKPETDTEKPAG